jgi:hypothetical protein
VVANEGASVWLYLTERDGKKPIADCWLLNTVLPPTELHKYPAGKSAPPATQAYAGPDAQRPVPVEGTVEFRWSDDGESVAVLVNGDLLGFIAEGSTRGFSKHLVASGPFGRPLDRGLYATLFKPE